MRAEAALVLACARVAPAAHDLSRIAASASATRDWDGAVQLGIRHGLGPLMHRNLAAAGIDVPRHPGAALWARAQWAARRAEEMLRELGRIAAALRACGIRFISFKGPLLAQRLLGDAALRESGDLDLLVAPADMPRARACLEALDYSLPRVLEGARERLWLSSPARHELMFSRPGQGFVVELQWRANPELDVPRMSDDDWWRGAPALEYAAFEWIQIPPGEELLALLVHGSKHGWGSLAWLVDVAEIARRREAPWPALVRLARTHRVVRRAALGLELARRLLDAPLPVVADDLIAEARIAALADQLTPRLLDTEFRAPAMREALHLQLKLYDTRAQRARCIGSSLRPTPGDWDWVRLPRGLEWLYWPLRPVRLAAKYAFTARSPRTPAVAKPRTPPPRPHSTG